MLALDDIFTIIGTVLFIVEITDKLLAIFVKDERFSGLTKIMVYFFKKLTNNHIELTYDMIALVSIEV